MKWLSLRFLFSCICVSLLAPHIQAQSPKALAVGSKAPAFEAINQEGQTWKSSDHIGKKAVILYFYPKDATPGCTAQACGLRDRMEELKKDNVEVVGVSFDAPDSHHKFMEDQKLNFTLLADTEGKVADLFGTRKESGAKIARRVSFLIARDGTIAHVTDTPSAAVHLEEMKTAVEKIRGK